MGLKSLRLASWAFVLLFFGEALIAAPKLRLETTAFGPISIAVGQNGPAQSVSAYNLGDGSLNLAVVSSADWLTPSVGAPAPCGLPGGTCIPINLSLQTAGTAKGIFTAVVTVSDPNAVDAPQSISVTVQMDGGVPDRADFLVTPNGPSERLSFKTNSMLRASVTTQSGGSWLSFAMEGAGSFDFVRPYRITAKHLAGLPDGTYNGNIDTAGASFAPDNKSIPVTMQVTSNPIATFASQIVFRLAQDTITQDQFLVLANRGLGTLAISGVTAEAAAGGTWLTAELIPDTTLVKVTAASAGVAPGRYEGTVNVETNAANGPHVVPVVFIVIAQSPPTIGFGGVVNIADFASGAPLPQGGIVAIFGEQFTHRAIQGAGGLPLPRELDGTKVLVNGQDTPLYFLSYGQINFQLPYEIPVGEALVEVTRDGLAGNMGSIQVVPGAPGLLRAGGNYVNAVDAANVQVGIPTRPAKRGEVIVVWSVGFGQTVPQVVSGEGAPFDPPGRVQPMPTAYFGSGFARVPSIPDFVGLTPGLVGLYQINVRVPMEAPLGDQIGLAVETATDSMSNQVDIAIE